MYFYSENLVLTLSLLSMWCTPCFNAYVAGSIPVNENFDPAEADPNGNLTCDGTIPNFLLEVRSGK